MKLHKQEVLLRHKRRGIQQCFEQGLTGREAAERLGLSVQTIGNAYRDLIRLRRQDTRNPYFPKLRESKQKSETLISNFSRNTPIREAACQCKLTEKTVAKRYAALREFLIISSLGYPNLYNGTGALLLLGPPPNIDNFWSFVQKKHHGPKRAVFYVLEYAIRALARYEISVMEAEVYKYIAQDFWIQRFLGTGQANSGSEWLFRTNFDMFMDIWRLSQNEISQPILGVPYFDFERPYPADNYDWWWVANRKQISIGESQRVIERDLKWYLRNHPVGKPNWKVDYWEKRRPSKEKVKDRVRFHYFRRRRTLLLNRQSVTDSQAMDPWRQLCTDIKNCYTSSIDVQRLRWDAAVSFGEGAAPTRGIQHLLRAAEIAEAKVDEKKRRNDVRPLEEVGCSAVSYYLAGRAGELAEELGYACIAYNKSFVVAGYDYFDLMAQAAFKYTYLYSDYVVQSKDGRSLQQLIAQFSKFKDASGTLGSKTDQAKILTSLGRTEVAKHKVEGDTESLLSGFLHFLEASELANTIDDRKLEFISLALAADACTSSSGDKPFWEKEADECFRKLTANLNKIHYNIRPRLFIRRSEWLARLLLHAGWQFSNVQFLEHSFRMFNDLLNSWDPRRPRGELQKWQGLLLLAGVGAHEAGSENFRFGYLKRLYQWYHEKLKDNEDYAKLGTSEYNLGCRLQRRASEKKNRRFALEALEVASNAVASLNRAEVDTLDARRLYAHSLITLAEITRSKLDVEKALRKIQQLNAQRSGRSEEMLEDKLGLCEAMLLCVECGVGSFDLSHARRALAEVQLSKEPCPSEELISECNRIEGRIRRLDS